MLHRIVSATILATVACAHTLAAAERGTFILNDGQRLSGVVQGFSNNQLALSTDDGRWLAFGVQQIAVIDFTGGQPSPGEFQMLPADNRTQLLVLSNGYSQRGHLIGGDSGSFVWLNEAGQQQPYAMRDVARVYLNPMVARSVLGAMPYAYTPNPQYPTQYPGYPGQYPGYTPSPSFGGIPGAVGTSGVQGYAAPVAVSVPGNRRWTDTGMIVRAGELVMFRSSGQVQFRRGNEGAAGPDGNFSFVRATYPVPSAPVGALIGRVDNSAPFVIGSQTQPIQVPANGRLFVGVNDDEYDDNGGAFSVTITPVR